MERGVDKARDHRDRAEEAGQPRTEERGSQAAHRDAGERVVAALGTNPVALQRLRDPLVEDVALPRRLAALAAVPPVRVPAVAAFGHDDDAREALGGVRNV